MAFQLKHWFGLVAACLAFVTVVRLPLGFVPPSEDGRSEAERRHTALTNELQSARIALDQIRRGRALPPVVIGSAVDRVSVVLPDHEEARPGNTDILRDMVRDVALGLPRRDAELVVAYLYDALPATASGLPPQEQYRAETYAGEHEGVPYCVQVMVTRPESVGQLITLDLRGRGWNRLAGGRSPLGPCELYAEHGLPGPLIQEWLAEGGIGLALGSRTSRRAIEMPIPRRTFFGIVLVSGALSLERCTAGDEAACRSVFLEPALVAPDGTEPVPMRDTPAVMTGISLRFGYVVGGEAWFVLSDLEREFGPAAFRAFWTSERDVPAAFEAAFGVDVGEWLMQWVGDAVGIEPSGPLPTAAATFGSLLFVSLLTGIATYWQRRREVA